jgi:hypothetical protein
MAPLGDPPPSPSLGTWSARQAVQWGELMFLEPGLKVLSPLVRYRSCRTPLLPAGTADRAQPSFWQYCSTLLHQQAAMVFGGSITHGRASTPAHMLDKASAVRPAAARRLLAQQMRPPWGSQQYSVLGSLGAVPLLAVGE